MFLCLISHCFFTNHFQMKIVFADDDLISSDNKGIRVQKYKGDLWISSVQYITEACYMLLFNTNKDGYFESKGTNSILT